MYNNLIVKKKKFTLIELIVVIGILAILTSLVMPNIKGIEGEAKGVALATDRKAIQTAVDMYKVDNIDEPILDGEVIEIGIPGTISMNKLYPKYLRDFPGTAGAKYWLDYTGKVWLSLADAPTGLTNTNGDLSWDAVEGAVEYIVYEYSDVNSNSKYNLTKIVRVKETSYTGLKVDGKYLVQSVDSNNNKSPLVNKDYSSYMKKTYSDKRQLPWNHWVGGEVTQMTSEELNNFNYSDLTPTNKDYFVFDENIGEITDYNSQGPQEVIIPQTINGVEVKSIGSQAFRDKFITHLVIPETITEIGTFGFYDNNLISVIVPNSMVAIKDNSFAYNNLCDIAVPNSVVDIGWSAFRNNPLINVSLSKNVIEIGNHTFNSTGLSSIKLESNIKKIGFFSFYNTNLTSITIGEGVDIDSHLDSMGVNKGFKNYYDSNNKKAGTYRYIEGIWSIE